MILFGVLEYYGVIQLTQFSETIFYSLYSIPGLFLIPILLAGAAGYYTHKVIRQNFYLDQGLELKKAEGNEKRQLLKEEKLLF